MPGGTNHSNVYTTPAGIAADIILKWGKLGIQHGMYIGVAAKGVMSW